ncbi:Xaa-Pro peptidase family protein [Hyphococcus formosus]|uniref:M24 family metallopeptidase n=1 Tax=Hyphococcus formosus TaxID=3143534 RepID=UPI00398B9FF7
MRLTKRDLIKASGLAGIAAATGTQAANAASRTDMAVGAKPITADERRTRIEKVQGLMRDQGISALLLDAGSAMVYFTGINWWRSERLTGVIIPADGEIAVVTPYFEEPSIRESLMVGDDVRTWHEHESPFELVAGILKDRGLTKGKLAIEETVRHFIVDGVAKAAPEFEIVSGHDVTLGVRLYKSPAELALMQIANNITLAAYKHVHSKIEAGMSQQDISALMSATTAQLGGAVSFSMALIGESSAYPHGSNKPQTVQEGSIILMDCGCSVHDYQSDISRTWVFGEPTAKQRKVWNTVKQGQELALESAQLGVSAGTVDDVVRRYYEAEGFGPGYKTPGLPHRLGHGIGMDVHEPVNFVHGEEKPLAPGMCFSNEPGIYLFGEFGVRLEDCLYMTEDGPKLFTDLSPSIDAPFG